MNTTFQLCRCNTGTAHAPMRDCYAQLRDCALRMPDLGIAHTQPRDLLEHILEAESVVLNKIRSEVETAGVGKEYESLSDGERQTIHDRLLHAYSVNQSSK